MPRKLIHYLRNERKRLGLTQADIAALLGMQWKTRVSKYERGEAQPSLDLGLAYQQIYGKPISEIFVGRDATIRTAVRARARHLLKDLPDSGSEIELRRKRSLEHIAA
ncbi:MAG TPA: helix-turn-helix transcriptional regulator [Thermoanaerobaculia bacterium]|jgi:transcriptional regulator with XRE-family HTH domain